MTHRIHALAAAAALLFPTITSAQQAGRTDPNAGPVARFDWFSYEGRDSVFRIHPRRATEFANPILAGFYPDPSITRAGDDYYLVTSTFSYFPGLPIFHSRDLVTWTQIGNGIDRPTQVKFDSLGMSRGLFAPAIEHHAGTFYIANTCVDCGGNFIITATNPAGPWSDPVWLPTVEGIDPSLFFDDDGKVYLVNNRAPIGGSKYQGHRAIWVQEYDPAQKRMVGESTQIVDGGIDITQKPIWIEGPHLYKVDGKYYLNMAEGGTAHDHRQVIMRADRVRGPYVAGPVNPILTQRHLDPQRPFPVTAAGHADYVQTPSGEWWAIFLGMRPYTEDYHNTGRETFMLPIKWENGWPSFVGGLEPIKYALPRPALPAQRAAAIPTSGNFTVRDEFDGPTLAPYWLMARTPREQWYDFASSPGALTLRARAQDIASRGQPSFLGRRQQHLDAVFTTAMRFTPTREGERAGLVAWQNDEYFYAFTLTRQQGQTVLQLQKRAGRAETPTVIASAPLAPRSGAPIFLKIEAHGATYDFYYGTTKDRWTPLLKGADGRILSTRVAGSFGGNFTGVLVGPYAFAPAP